MRNYTHESRWMKHRKKILNLQQWRRLSHFHAHEWTRAFRVQPRGRWFDYFSYQPHQKENKNICGKCFGREAFPQCTGIPLRRNALALISYFLLLVTRRHSDWRGTWPYRSLDWHTAADPYLEPKLYYLAELMTDCPTARRGDSVRETSSNQNQCTSWELSANKKKKVLKVKRTVSAVNISSALCIDLSFSYIWVTPFLRNLCMSFVESFSARELDCCKVQQASTSKVEFFQSVTFPELKSINQSMGRSSGIPFKLITLSQASGPWKIAKKTWRQLTSIMKAGANQSCPLPGLLTCALLRAPDVKRKSCKLANCTTKARGCNPCLFINLTTWENLFITRREVAKNRGLVQKRKCERTMTILLRSSRRTIHTQRRRF